MKEYIMKTKDCDNINIIMKFLACRDIDSLDKEELFKKYGLEKVDILLLLCNSVLYTVQVASDAFKKGICDKLMLVGGIGHSTQILRDNIKIQDKYNTIETRHKSEAQMVFDILVDYYQIPKEKIILETKSTNCGSNAVESYKIIEELDVMIRNIILIQDPTMQLRTYATYQKYFNHLDIKFINFAPFMPFLIEANNKILFNNEDICGIWNIERFLSLVMGEIPRLRDDINGYGPRGKDFIIHIDIPLEVLKAYEELEENLSYYLNLRK